MTRLRNRRPRPVADTMSDEEKQVLRAELESRLDQLRANINAKRRARGMVEIEDGVWVMPDAHDADAPSPNLIVVNPPPLR